MVRVGLGLGLHGTDNMVGQTTCDGGGGGGG